MPKSAPKHKAKIIEIPKKISDAESKTFLTHLESRFAQNMKRHPDLEWKSVSTKLSKDSKKLLSLWQMESTGGEPDVIGIDPKTKEIIFCDCSEQTPNRQSICYDQAAEQLRVKKNVFPAGNAVDLAAKMDIEILDEEQYRYLQTLGEFDTKTSSWLKTPDKIRALGGAIFGDRRFDHVFIYHNGADSFYSGRGFRGMLKI